MSEKETMTVSNWIPQVKSNNISIQSTNRIKPRLLTTLKLKYISTKESNLKRTMLYFRILEPKSLNVVNKCMNEKGFAESNLPFWYNITDNEFILKVSSQNCKCNIGFEKMKYNIDAEFKIYTT